MKYSSDPEVGRCLEHKEPVLLVGETGCGKTTVCQLYAALLNRKLHMLNCHQVTSLVCLKFFILFFVVSNVCPEH
jgi:midasin (ATPase involved in ribosome maturation)